MRQGIQTIWRAWAVATVAAILVPSIGLADDAVADLEAQHAILRTRDDGLGIRGILRFALEAAGNRWNPAAVEEALVLARSMQEITPRAADFGNFRWRLGDAGITDPNAVEFALQLTSLLRVAHHDALTTAARDMLDTIHADALVAVTRHAVKPGYTNIFLMNTWDHLALGQSRGDAIEQEGSRKWDQSIAHVRRHGITEYSSPTYYGTDLDSLGLIARHARNEQIRREAEVWSDGRRLEHDATLAADATVFLKKEGVVIGIRGLLDSRHAEAPRRLQLRHDAAHIGAKRLTALFHAGRPRGRSILALEIEGREDCDAARADAFCREFSGRRVTASLEGDRLRVDGSLPLEADFGRLERVACEPLLDENSLLVVNGQEIGRLAFPSIAANTSPTD